MFSDGGISPEFSGPLFRRFLRIYQVDFVLINCLIHKLVNRLLFNTATEFVAEPTAASLEVVKVLRTLPQQQKQQQQQ